MPPPLPGIENAREGGRAGRGGRLASLPPVVTGRLGDQEGEAPRLGILNTTVRAPSSQKGGCVRGENGMRPRDIPGDPEAPLPQKAVEMLRPRTAVALLAVAAPLPAPPEVLGAQPVGARRPVASHTIIPLRAGLATRLVASHRAAERIRGARSREDRAAPPLAERTPDSGSRPLLLTPHLENSDT